MFPRMSFRENTYCMFWGEYFYKAWSVWIMITFSLDNALDAILDGSGRLLL